MARKGKKMKTMTTRGRKKKMTRKMGKRRKLKQPTRESPAEEQPCGFYDDSSFILSSLASELINFPFQTQGKYLIADALSLGGGGLREATV